MLNRSNNGQCAKTVRRLRVGTRRDSTAVFSAKLYDARFRNAKWVNDATFSFTDDLPDLTPDLHEMKALVETPASDMEGTAFSDLFVELFGIYQSGQQSRGRSQRESVALTEV